MDALRRDPDEPIARIGKIFGGRLLGWRGDRAAMYETAVINSPRMDDKAPLAALIDGAIATGTVDDALWERVAVQFGGPRPRRFQLLLVQLVAELAALHGVQDLACRALELAIRLGLIDILWVDRCPLFAGMTDPRWARLRDHVALQAAQVLAAFRAGRE